MLSSWRRLIVRYFGSTKTFFIWTLAIFFVIYFIDNFILTKERLRSLIEERPIAIEKSKNEIIVKNQFYVQTSLTAISKRSVNPFKASSCVTNEVCNNGQYSYFIQSGHGHSGVPRMCFNGFEVFETEDAKKQHREPSRGLNVAIFDPMTFSFLSFRGFDTYITEDDMIRFFTITELNKGSIILMTTMDEASRKLTKASFELLKSFGITLINTIDFRDTYSVIGQYGLNIGGAREQLNKRKNGEEYAPSAVLSGCISIPIGPLLEHAVIPTTPKHIIGEILPNCGVKKQCDTNAFPVHLFSGRGNEESPKICVNGKYIFAKGLNNAGRGFNVVVVDPKTKSHKRIGRFDTYEKDSSNLEIFLEMLNENDIILTVVNDDASRNLGDHAKSLLELIGSSMIMNLTFRDNIMFVYVLFYFTMYSLLLTTGLLDKKEYLGFRRLKRLSNIVRLQFSELGSAMIQNLKFRDIWIYVGQKGINGFSEIEQLEFAGPNGRWPKTIDKRICVPTKIIGMKIRPDPMSNKNEKKRKFCEKYDGHEDFCDSRLDEKLTPSPLADSSLINHEIFKVPILVVPGLNQIALRMQLESLMLQPGIQPAMVDVLYDEKFEESLELSKLFGFKTRKLTSSTKYAFQMKKALDGIWLDYPNAKSVIVLEEDVIVASDFLHYHAQLLSTVENDETLMGTSAWNPNGYKSHSTSPEIVYRAEIFPGFGFLLKRTFFEKNMKNNFASCCENRVWNSWKRPNNMGMLLPDVSRVLRRPFDGLSSQAEMLTNLFNKERVTNLDSKTVLENVEELIKPAYDKKLQAKINSANVLDVTNSDDCLTNKGVGFYIPAAKGRSHVIYFEQTSKQDRKIVNELCRCFGLFYSKGYNCTGLYEDVLRFTQDGSDIFLVGSKSVFFQTKNVKSTNLVSLPKH